MVWVVYGHTFTILVANLRLTSRFQCLWSYQYETNEYLP
jgi:hypothetical protein